jgi:hypothetical protein
VEPNNTTESKPGPLEIFQSSLLQPLFALRLKSSQRAPVIGSSYMVIVTSSTREGLLPGLTTNTSGSSNIRSFPASSFL